jgi:hypothetical protein
MTRENSLANMNKPHPIGYKQKVGRYWRVKVAPGSWEYTHVILAEKLLGRELAPNERVYFTAEKPNPRAYKDPLPDDIEVRIISPRAGKPPGRRKYLIRKIMQLEFELEERKEQLAALNEYYGKKPDDMRDPSLPRDWRPKR